MQIGNHEAERLAREGLEALRQGRAPEARNRFEAATRTAPANAKLGLLLAIACRAHKDEAAEEAALDRLLEIEPQAVRGLIMKGDCRVKAGEERVAVLLYRNALRIAEGQSLPPADVAELRRAEEIVRKLDARHSARLEESLSAQGMTPENRSARFQHSLDIMAGRKQVYYQAPTGYYFPELAHTQYFDTAQFDWAPALEAATDAIRGELRAVLAGGLEGFRPYIQSEANQPRQHPLLDKKDWSALFLCENGKRFEEAIARCPKTWEAVQAAPQLWIERSSPTAMFSLLRPGTRIPAHSGVQNTRLTCHLPLIVPPGCGFRVGNEAREWVEGKLLVFDDTIEHEAWNDGNEDRVVLIFDIGRPDMSEREHAEVAALFSIAMP
jgi:aspartyl/asparaginyl beta-hydroxylase (cupin superfamily)